VDPTGEKVGGEIKLNRPPTTAEKNLIDWMLEHGELEAQDYLPQLKQVRVSNFRCPCGCASLDFVMPGSTEPVGEIQPIAEYIFGNGGELSGIFVCTSKRVLAGHEVYGLTGDAPKLLPTPNAMRPFRSKTSQRTDDSF
jgi:hypothetical protein